MKKPDKKLPADKYAVAIEAWNKHLESSRKSKKKQREM
jgi:hypothetical protein